MASSSLDNQSKQLQEAFNEISNLRCKLDSKSRALVILSQDLLECKRERDEYKLMCDQVKDRYSSLKRRIDGLGANLIGVNNDTNLTSASFAQILCKLNKQNKMLLYELEETRTKLIDAEGDVRLLRGQINTIKRRPGMGSFSVNSSLNHNESIDKTNNGPGGLGLCNNLLSSSSSLSPSLASSREKDEKQTLVAQLEIIKQRNCLLEKDMQSLLDEKEELIMIRDAYKAKVERLNERLNHLLRAQCDDPNGGDGSNEMKTVDIDGLINENNFLREKITQLDEEKQRLKALCTKYRNMLEKSSSSSGSSVFSFDPKSKLFADHHNLTLNNVISSKQVQHFIASNNLNNLTLSQGTLVQLKSLVIALFESLTDKSSALALQRKNNRLLGERLEELEEKIKQLKAREKVFLLMKDNGKEELFQSEDLDDIIVRNEPTMYSSSSVNQEDKSERDIESNAGDEMKSRKDESDDEIQLPSNLKALVEEECQKIKKNNE